MSSNPEGLRIALDRIAEEKEKRTGFLDLGCLGLAELPEVLFELDHLRVLVLGQWWLDQESAGKKPVPTWPRTNWTVPSPGFIDYAV